ncbi:MAG: hypothetical protein CHACPFDD_04136 [Phycisphaerae bacterium]|nr:hypothetical protein [Phycisphaerae bacterium]
MNTRLYAFLTALTLACAAMTAPVAIADTYTFDGSEDEDWANPDNWTPAGTPDAGNTAVIPNGLTCKVMSANAVAKIIQVAGTLGIEGYKLTLGSTSENTTSTINNGEIYFKKPGNDTPELLIHKTVTFDSGGLGTITARTANGYGPGLISDADDPANSGIILDAATLLVGNFTITVDVTNNGNLRSDGAGDTLALGVSESPPTNVLNGSGELRASGGGTVRINAMDVDGAGTWTVTGNDNSLLWLTDKFTIADTGTFSVSVQVWQGTLDIDADFLTHGALHFGNLNLFQPATIKVASGKAAEFNVDD